MSGSRARIRLPFLLLAAAAVLVPAGTARAQSCSLSSTPVVFGQYDPFSASSTDSTGTISVTCASPLQILVSYTIRLDGGRGGVVGARRMNAGVNNLFYQLYDSASRATVWGDGTGGSVTKSSGYLLGVLTPVVQTFTAYARIAARQNVGPGAYSDAVTVLLTY